MNRVAFMEIKQQRSSEDAFAVIPRLFWQENKKEKNTAAWQIICRAAALVLIRQLR
ncbi:MAG: hypothetical protein Q4C59_07560 [Lachnospiraceae bacterium]|nr:hypothetical protein [Lachnospiraceae bacterium]